VIEVGPGTGTLTEELLARCRQVIVVEIDRNLASLLVERLGAGTDILKFLRIPEQRLLLVEGDAMAGKHHLNPLLLQAIGEARLSHRPVKLVANLPYQIASPLIIELLLGGVDLLAFTVQKEVADRLRAVQGSDQYGALSVMIQLLARVEVLRTIPPQAFWPAPKVDSALVRLTRCDRLGEHAREFSVFIQKLFSARRKTMRKALVQAGLEPDSALAMLGVDAESRPETISPPMLLSLFDVLRPSEGQASRPSAVQPE
jgi:16S rRNA (adenine1518-N6/adenine1519-N6)-dimethyltransferase